MVTPADIAEASRRIAGRVRVTPVMNLEDGSFGSAGHLVVKLESLQRSGSFKARGAFNRILSGNVPESGVIAASGGNHGAAVALASLSLGFRAEIYVPEVASPPRWLVLLPTVPTSRSSANGSRKRTWRCRRGSPSPVP